MGWGPLELLVCPVRHPQRYSNHTVDSFCVPSVLRLQSPNFTSSEHTVCVPNQTLCDVDSHPEPNAVLIPGVHSVPRLCGNLSCQHLLSKRDKVLCRLLAVHALKWIRTSLAPGQDASGVLRQPWYDKSVITEWFLRPAFDMTLDCSDDPAQ